MKEVNTTPGKYQVVRSENGCTVSQTLDNGQRIEDNVPAGESTAVFAFTSRIEVDDDSAVVREVFKSAPYQKLRLLGVVGGNGGLPAGYKRVEWLDCTRDVVQYIETPIYIDEFCEISATFWSEYETMISRTSRLDGNGILEQMQIWNMKSAGSWFGDVAPYSQISINDYDYNKICTFKNSATGFKVNDEFYPRDVNISSAALTKATFFSSVITETGYKGARIYECAITKNDKYLFRAIPCLDPTGAPCMYDFVSRKPYYNQGSGDFIYPTETATYSLRRVLPDWGKLTEHGLRRLYHAPADWQGELYDYALENGYKPIVETEQPEEGYWAPRWTETEEEIVLEWVETEPPTDEFGMPAEPLTNE